MVVPPPAERFHVIEDTHIELQHVGKEKLGAYLAERFWWPGMKSDVGRYCDGCLECSLHSAVFRRKDVL